MKIFGTDYDGVIINIEPQKAQAFGEIMQKFWGAEIKEAADFWMAKGGTSRRFKFDYFFLKKYQKQLSDEEYKKVENEFSLLLKTKFYPTVQLLPGAKELLEFAGSYFDYTFVSSGVKFEEIKYLVNLNGVAQFFDIVLGTNEKYHSKKDHFSEILKDKNPELLVFVADSAEDMKISKEFGAKTIGVTTNHKKEELLSAGADSVAKDLEECKNALQNLLQS